MKRTLYQDGFDVSQDDLKNTEDTKIEALKERTSDLYGKGIVSGLEVTLATYPNINIADGIAYDEDGERINVVTAILNQSVGIGINYVKLKYVDVEGSPIAHPITGVVENTRVTESYLLTIDTVAPITGEVLIKRVTNSGLAPLVLDDVGVVFAGFNEIVESRVSTVYGSFDKLDSRLEAYELDGKNNLDDTVVPGAVATSLLNRLNMFARRIKDIIGTGTSWLDALPISLANLLAKFDPTTGHGHTGVTGDGPKIGATGLQNNIDASGISFNAAQLGGRSPGNADGNIPVSNGTICQNLNAERLGGYGVADFVKKGTQWTGSVSVPTGGVPVLTSLGPTNNASKIGYIINAYTDTVGKNVITGEIESAANDIAAGILASTSAGTDSLYLVNNTAATVVVYYTVTLLYV